MAYPCGRQSGAVTERAAFLWIAPISEQRRRTVPNLPPKKAQDYSEVQDWPGYFAVDIAAGEGRDTRLVTFAEMEVRPGDLVKANFALPFCGPRHFPAFRSRIVAAIRPGGRVAGQFFGDRDSRAAFPDRTHHSRDAVLTLLCGFAIELMREEERDDPPDVRSPKHWQLFHMVARQRCLWSSGSARLALLATITL